MAVESWRQPRTTAGRQLRSLILPDAGEEWRAIAKDAAVFLARAPASAGLSDVAGDAFATLVRRRFVHADPRDISRYAAEAITRVMDHQAGGSLVRAAEAAMRAVLSERWFSQGAGSVALGRAQLAIMRDLISQESMTSGQVDELIAFAEDLSYRRSRFRPTEGVYRSRMRKWFRRLRGPGRASSQRDRSVENTADTLIGQRQFARMTGDMAALARLPYEQRERDGQAVVNALFEISIKRRFAPGCCLRDIAVFVAEMSRRVPRKLQAGFLEVETIIRHQLGEPLSIDDIDPTAALEARLAAARSAIIDLGLFDHELIELLRQSEQLAMERGFQPTPAIRLDNGG